MDDDALAVARALAAQSGGSLGKALSELARRGFRRTSGADSDSGVPAFGVPPEAPPITSDDVRRAPSDRP